MIRYKHGKMLPRCSFMTSHSLADVSSSNVQVAPSRTAQSSSKVSEPRDIHIIFYSSRWFSYGIYEALPKNLSLPRDDGEWICGSIWKTQWPGDKDRTLTRTGISTAVPENDIYLGARAVLIIGASRQDTQMGLTMTMYAPYHCRSSS